MKQIDGEREKQDSSGSKDATPPPKVPAPSPKGAAKPPVAPPADSVPATEGVRLGRLRRFRLLREV